MITGHHFVVTTSLFAVMLVLMQGETAPAVAGIAALSVGALVLTTPIIPRTLIFICNTGDKGVITVENREERKKKKKK